MKECPSGQARAHISSIWGIPVLNTPPLPRRENTNSAAGPPERPERRPPLGEKASRPAPFPPGASPPMKRPRVPVSLQQALAALPHQKNPVQVTLEGGLGYVIQ